MFYWEMKKIRLESEQILICSQLLDQNNPTCLAGRKLRLDMELPEGTHDGFAI
ncbi:hypothetical protein [Legionella bozemanae]|uniref:hypothetical protein n=1 Tax=Legionella bozemanae TaxID=447 RepID=UPI00399D4086